MSSFLHDDYSSPEEDDDVFIKSKLDMMVDGKPRFMGLNASANYFQHVPDFESIFPSTQQSTPSPKPDQNAVIFSVNFGGKHLGDLGLFEPYISNLNWTGFKSYLFTSLNLEYSDDCTITYNDEDGDKVSVDTEEEYQEAMRIAKLKSSIGEKVVLDISRVKGFPYTSSLKSLVSSGIRRVNSVGSKNSQSATPVALSAAMSASLGNDHSISAVNILDCSTDYMCFEDSPDLVRSENARQKHPDGASTKRMDEDFSFSKDLNIKNSTNVDQEVGLREELSFLRQKEFCPHQFTCPNELDPFKLKFPNDHKPDSSPSHSEYYRILNKVCEKFSEIQSHEEACKMSKDGYSHRVDYLYSPPNPFDQEIQEPPSWFLHYMEQFKNDLSKELSNKIDEKLEDLMGSLNASEVETKLRSLLSEYNSHVQEKVICCCKAPGVCTDKELPVSQAIKEHLPRSLCENSSPRDFVLTQTECTENEQLNMKKSKPHSSANEPDILTRKGFGKCRSKLDKKRRRAELVNYGSFLRMLKRIEHELQKCIDKHNEKFKRKIEMNDNLQKSYSQLKDQDFAIQERERVLARIEGFHKRHNKTLVELGKLHKLMEGEHIKALISKNEDKHKRKFSDIQLQEKDAEVNLDSTKKLEYDAKFIQDCNFPDGSRIFPGEVFVKEWLVKNNGTKRWTEKTTLYCTSSSLLIPEESTITCPPLYPDNVGALKLTFTAPRQSGCFTSTFRFHHGTKLFGDHIWVNIEVIKPTPRSRSLIEPLRLYSPPPNFPLFDNWQENQSPADDALDSKMIHGRNLIEKQITGLELFSVQTEGNFLSQIPYNKTATEKLSTQTTSALELVKHVNYGNFHVVAPNEAFLKKWLVKNVGENPWSNKTKLYNVRDIPFGEPLVAKIPHILPDQMGIIEILLKAGSDKSAVYFSDFALQDDDGQFINAVIPCCVHTFIAVPVDPSFGWEIRMEDNEPLMSLHLKKPLSAAAVEAPQVPVPQVSVPHVSVPHVSVPQVPVSHVSVPHVPVPQVPVSHVPVPQVPVSHVSVPHVPVPQVPVSHVSVPHVPVPANEEISAAALCGSAPEDESYCSKQIMDDEEIIDNGSNSEEEEGEEVDNVEYEGGDEEELESYFKSEDNVSFDSDSDSVYEKSRQLRRMTRRLESEPLPLRSPDVESDSEDDRDYYATTTTHKSIKEELEEQQELIESHDSQGESGLDSRKESQGESGLDSRGESDQDSKGSKEKVSTLQEAFQQNVDINLDFEVLPRMAIKNDESENKPNEGGPSSDSLRFEEKHFMVSTHRPPPPPLPEAPLMTGLHHSFPDSDDESLDGIVFIGRSNTFGNPVSCMDESITEDSFSRDRSESALDDDLLESSVTCSSFSELDNENDDLDESGDDDPVSTNLTSPDEAGSVYYDTSHNSEGLQDAPLVDAEDGSLVKQNSSEQKPDSARDGSTTPTLKETTASSDSFEPLEIPHEMPSTQDPSKVSKK